MTPLALGNEVWEVPIDPAWPGFAGHHRVAGKMPGDPVVPGAELVEWALAIAGPAAELLRARFVTPVRPGEVVRLTRAMSSRGMVVVASCAGRTVAELLFAKSTDA